MSGLRVAVAVPSLPRDAPHRLAFEAVLEALAREGLDLEGFAEHDCPDEKHWQVPLFHYLRFRERHRARRFDLGLYLLGRDVGPFQAAIWLMHQFPGVVWILDPIMHHLAVGGLLRAGRPGVYGKLMRRCFGARGAPIYELVLNGGATSTIFRNRSVASSILGEPREILATHPSLAAALEDELGWPEEIPAIDLPFTPSSGSSPRTSRPDMESGNDAERAAGGRIELAILSTHLADPQPMLAGLQALLDSGLDLGLQACVPAAILDGIVAPAAKRLGLDAGIRWVPTDDWGRLGDVASGADVVAFLRHHLLGGERAILLRALADGKVVVVADTETYRDLPEGVVLKVPTGRTLAPTLSELVRTLLDAPDLAAEIRRAARDFAAGLPDGTDTAAALEARLEEVAARDRAEPRRISEPIWKRVRRELRSVGYPPGADPGWRAEIDALVDEITGVPDAFDR